MASTTAVPMPSGSPPPYEELPERTKPVRTDDVDDRLPSDVEDDDEVEEDERLLNRHSHEVQMRARIRLAQSQADLQNFRDRFEMNRPSVWKRVALIGFLLFVLWVGFRLRLSGVEETVIHSERYSGKYKYRPAASPVITTHMPDGKLKVRGDEVGAALQKKRIEQRMIPTNAVQVKGGKKGKGKRAKKPKETTPPRKMSREA